jgi:2-methylcitrate dehydratase PrpD
MPASEQLAEHIARARYEDLPGPALIAAKRSIIDTLAVAIAARSGAAARAVMKLGDPRARGGASACWSNGERRSPHSAAFINSALGASLDFDSLYPRAAIHPDIVVVPVAMALCEMTRRDGRDLLAAVVLGDDLICRLGRAMHGNSGWFHTSLYGSVTSAAITAKLLGGDARQLAGAMGLGFMNAAGTQQPAVERSIGKRLQAAFSAANGVSAGQLAREGLGGPLQIFEGRFGFFNMYEKGDIGAITERLGERYLNTGITYKAYPSCQCNHAAIEGMLQLKRELSLQPEAVAHIEVIVSPYMARLVGAPFAIGDNPQVDAQFSVQYSIASVLERGKLGIREIQDEAVRDPRIARLMERIKVTIDPANGGLYAPVRLKVQTRGGRALDLPVLSYAGSAERPITDAQLREKWCRCLEAGGCDDTDRHAQSLFDRLMSIEQERDIAAFTEDALSILAHAGT